MTRVKNGIAVKILTATPKNDPGQKWRCGQKSDRNAIFDPISDRKNLKSDRNAPK